MIIITPMKIIDSLKEMGRNFCKCGMTGWCLEVVFTSMESMMRTKTVNLSEPVYGSTSVSAIGVAAHECGHAIQDNVGYAPLRLRAAFVPVANLGSTLSWPLILLGLVIGLTPFIQVGIWMFVLALLFQVITLPVEFNASGRAVALLGQIGILQAGEVEDTKKVLGAAALTYVAAVAASVLQLLRLLILFGGRRRDD